MRGQHFGFLGTLCVIWIMARVGFLALLPADISPARFPKQRPSIKSILAAQNSPNSIAPDQPRAAIHISFPPDPDKRHVRFRAELLTRRIAFIDVSSNPAVRPIPPHLVAPHAEQPDETVLKPEFRPTPPRLDVYAYSFFRQGSGGSGLAGTGQYGGSQSGFVATYALDANAPATWSILARGAIAHDRLAERELAAGLRWQPSRRLPLTLTAERRFRHARSDAFAVYLAGGKSQVVLPQKFRLDAFAQAGLVSGKDGGPFFDISTRAERKLASIGNAPVTMGGGLWGGGQEGIFRIDAGPTIGTEIPVGTTRLRVNADWRFRIAGDAAPASGPALTLSTSF
jgi:hypothetical protein